jgi:hypothetical protein
MASLLAAGAGLVAMAVASAFTEGSARVAVLGAAHSAAYLVGALVLAGQLRSRLGGSVRPGALGRTVAIAAAAGLGGWLAAEAALDGASGRLVDVLTCAGIGVVGAIAVVGAYRVVGVRALLTARTARVETSR